MTIFQKPVMLMPLPGQASAGSMQTLLLSHPAPMNKNAHCLAVIGATSQILIPIGFVVSQMRIHSAISGLDLSQPSGIQQAIFSLRTKTGDVGTAFEFFLWAFGFSMLGLVLFIVALTGLKYRRKWAFWFSCIYGVCLTCLFPIGKLFGLFILIYGLIRRQEFESESCTSASSTSTV